jgi:hypothetical protein
MVKNSYIYGIHNRMQSIKKIVFFEFLMYMYDFKFSQRWL